MSGGLGTKLGGIRENARFKQKRAEAMLKLQRADVTQALTLTNTA